jgi:GT2 family glycosyltransferase
MKSAIAILTYRRLPVLQETLKGINQFCAHYPLAIFEDCGQRDGTSTFLTANRRLEDRPVYAAVEAVPEVEATLSAEEILLGVKPPQQPRHFLGNVNLGVAGNSNRAIKWFMDETDADHLCLLNDDLHVLGDFVAHYAAGHRDLGTEMFCFCPSGGSYSHPSYIGPTVRSRGFTIKLMPRFTGIMMSVTRKLVEKIGYFDARFGKFGEEHCDWTIRARFAGGIKLDGQDQNCLDLEATPPVLQHQEVATSVTGPERAKADQEASAIMRQCSSRYGYEHYYRPFALSLPKNVGGFLGQGIPYHLIHNHTLVQARA